MMSTIIKTKSVLEDLSKGFKLKSVYTAGGKNNTEKAYDELVLNNKNIDDVHYKKAMSLVIGMKIFFRKQKIV